MSFDARSRERLESLGRQLPQKLPPPPPRQTTADAPASASRPLHRVESEEDPQALFHALMQASPDGSVPPHLLERLRGLELDRSQPPGLAAPSAGAASALSPGAPSAGAIPPRRRPGSGPTASATAPGAGSDRDLYDAFDDLLHQQDDELPAPPPASRREPDARLLPRPTLRTPRAS